MDQLALRPQAGATILGIDHDHSSAARIAA